MRKFLYFRTVADEANDGVTGLKTNNPSSFMFDAENLTAMQPISDTVLTLYFKPALAHSSDYGMQGLRDTVNLTVSQGDTFEVMSAISDAIFVGTDYYLLNNVEIPNGVTLKLSGDEFNFDRTQYKLYIQPTVAAAIQTILR